MFDFDDIGIFYNRIVLTKENIDVNDFFCLKQNRKEIISAQIAIFIELFIILPISVVIEKGDSLVSSHDCTLIHYDIGFAATYVRRIITLQKEKETKFDLAEGSYIVFKERKEK